MESDHALLFSLEAETLKSNGRHLEIVAMSEAESSDDDTVVLAGNGFEYNKKPLPFVFTEAPGIKNIDVRYYIFLDK